MTDAAGTAPLLVEIGTEELPPKALRGLSEEFARALCAGLEAERLSFGEATPYATPRRLAVLVDEVACVQPGRQIERRGPRLDIAFDAEGNPTPAALGFARSCGVDVAELEPLETEKGTWLVRRNTQAGEKAASLIPGIADAALNRLPLPRRMRWSNREVQFIRPVHWAVLLLGDDVIEAEILGVRTGRTTRGHRFHHPDSIELRNPADYAGALLDTGRVIADFDVRIERIRTQAHDAAATVGGRPDADEALFEEVAALVEWPVALLGQFDAEFLELPEPVLSATMKGHQRYFPVRDAHGRLLPQFVAVANIESRNPDTVREGNERVIRPRLRDAEFFFREDLKRALAERRKELRGIVFQEGLGTLYHKSKRVSRLAGEIARLMGEPQETIELARRAGLLSKCDLVTEIVGEFPELQGIMGAEYARRSGEAEAVAGAIGEHYLPGFAGDALPVTPIGRALAIADRLDTLVGMFEIGQAPSGDRDPFGLRRAALGVLRILIEGELDLDLEHLLVAAGKCYSPHVVESVKPAPEAPSSTPAVGRPTPLQIRKYPGLAYDDIPDRVLEFLLDRLRTYFVDRAVPATVFAAVSARRPMRPLDFSKRIHAVDAFRRLPEAESLATANKRIGNILRQAMPSEASARFPAAEYRVAVDERPRDMATRHVDEALLSDGAERDLHVRLAALRPEVLEKLVAGDYTSAMQLLASLRNSVDAFFDSVLVMAEDEAVRANRLALLAQIHALFLKTADISLLQDW